LFSCSRFLICARQANLAFWEVKERLKRTLRNDSIEDIYIHGHGYGGLRSGKSSLLDRKGGHSRLGGRHSRLSTPPYFAFCGALFTYSLYELQVNGAGAWRTEGFIKPFLASTPKLNRKRGT